MDDGSLTASASASSGTGSRSVTVDPSGKYVHTGNAPLATTVAPSGGFAYVVNWYGNSVSQYIIGVDGNLTPMSMAITTPDTTDWSEAGTGNTDKQKQEG